MRFPFNSSEKLRTRRIDKRYDKDDVKDVLEYKTE